LVVASDLRLPAPNSEFEGLFGDGAAALLLSDSQVAVDLEAFYTVTSEFMDTWKTEADHYPRTWEDRFIFTHGYAETVAEAVPRLLAQAHLKPQDFTKLVLYAPDPPRHLQLARRLGFDPRTQLQEPLFSTVGHTGAAFSLMMLVAALEEAKAGDRILLVSYGDGCDAMILGVREGIEGLRKRRGIKGHVASKMLLPNYEKYLRFRDLLEWEAERRPPLTSSLTVLWRERKQILALKGQRCLSCGTVQYPMQRVCTWCQAKDNFEEVRLSDKKGQVFTFSMDELAQAPDLPSAMCIIDLEGGGRFYTVLTDRDPQRIEVGMPVELTFRKIHDGSGIHNYYWKARPVRC